MAINRRTLLKGLAAAGATALAAPRARPRRRRPTAAGLEGMLYDATLCIGCKACMVACREANDLAYTPGTTLWDEPVDLSAHEKNVIKLFRDGERSLLHEDAVHALRRPGLRQRLHARRAAEARRRRRRHLGRRLLRRLPLLPDRLPVRRPQVRVAERATRASSSASSATTGW